MWNAGKSRKIAFFVKKRFDVAGIYDNIDTVFKTADR